MMHLFAWYQQFSLFSKSNPMIAGAVSLWALSVFSYLARDIPKQVWNFISEQCTTSLIFDNSGYYRNRQQFDAFQKWFVQSKWSKWSRNLSLEGVWDNGDEIKIGVGFGFHFFFYSGKLFWFYKTKLPSTGTDIEKHQIMILCFGQNQKVIKNLIEEFRHRPDSTKVGVYSYNLDMGWTWQKDIPRRELDTVIINRDLKSKLIHDLDTFTESEMWYLERGLPYKLTTIFHGIPGTGKTSIIKALASHYQRDICVLNISTMSDKTFEKALTTVKPNSFVVIEDFDSATATHVRTKSEHQATDMERMSADFISLSETLSLTTILNTLDGIVSLHNVVVFMTTNHLDLIDPALIRKGRVDIIHEIPKLTDAEIKDYIHLMFPGKYTVGYHFQDITGCDLQALFFEHRNDPESFIQSIPHDFSLQRCLSEFSEQFTEVKA